MNLRTRVMVAGGILGALLGVGAAYVYLQSAPVQKDDQGNERLPAVNPGSALTVGLATMTVLKQIASLGKGK